MKIKVNIYKKNKLIKRMVGNRSKYRKVYSKLASAGSDKWYVEVTYGFCKDNFNKRILFKNEYLGNNFLDAKQAFKAFIEK